MRAYVVFTGKTELWYLKWLKAGFRHCFVILHDGRQWFSVDPLSNHMEVQVHSNLASGFDLPGWLRGRGHAVVQARPCRGQRKAAPLMPFTCVEAVKRILGLHKRSILTPWQLYRYLRHCERRKFSFIPTKGDLSWEA